MTTTNNYRVTWQIDQEAKTPEEAARLVWKQVFGRTTATADQACVFTVIDGDLVHEVDLSAIDQGTTND